MVDDEEMTSVKIEKLIKDGLQATQGKHGQAYELTLEPCRVPALGAVLKSCKTTWGAALLL